MVDKRNQNDIRKMLEKVDPENDGNPELANSKAKYFYQSCMNVSEEQEKVNLANLLDIIDQVGGWHLTGDLWRFSLFRSQNWLRKAYRLELQKGQKVDKTGQNLDSENVKKFDPIILRISQVASVFDHFWISQRKIQSESVCG